MHINPYYYNILKCVTFQIIPCYIYMHVCTYCQNSDNFTAIISMIYIYTLLTYIYIHVICRYCQNSHKLTHTNLHDCMGIYCQHSDIFIANISKVCIVHTVRILSTSWKMQLYMYGYILSVFWQFHCKYSHHIYIHC